MAKAHILVLPLPGQGHVTPLMELSHLLVDHGFEVTVDISKLIGAYTRHMPGHLERLIAEMEADGRPKVKWLVSDVLGIRVATFWPASVACLAINLKVPKLTEEGLLNNKGWPERDETFQLAPGIPPLHTLQLPWNNIGTAEVQPISFELFSRTDRLSAVAEMVVCNSFHEAKTGAFMLLPPSVLPIGPLSSNRKSVGQFLPEDTRCLRWLDAQPDGSIVYVAFGSTTVLEPCQFQELALGLELAGRPFLWVVRPDLTTTGELSKAWYDEFQARGGQGHGGQLVLAHHVVACFVSHCGWNSTMEGVWNGLSFLCWPYFFDQYIDPNYVTDVWRTGLAVSPDTGGVVMKEELRSWSRSSATPRSGRMYAARRCISQGRSSCDNLNKFVNLLSE
uniref:UDP-glycosyltransferases domain-containing protein n=1 Tax=Setaria viridis TaxID=4556 RepID=A0A4V6D1S8_SETVI|nr:hypothetical protein SEVIR_9G392500v2 [Setaria viridis]